MPDIFFKCEACDNHLIVDEARRGMPVACPACHAAISVPTGLSVGQCTHCGQRLMFASEMRGTLFHCSACRELNRAPGRTGSEAAEDARQRAESERTRQPTSKGHDEDRFKRKPR